MNYIYFYKRQGDKAIILVKNSTLIIFWFYLYLIMYINMDVTLMYIMSNFKSYWYVCVYNNQSNLHIKIQFYVLPKN